MANEKDVRHEKRVFTRFFVALTQKKFYAEPKMTFAALEINTWVELSDLDFFRIVEIFFG